MMERLFQIWELERKLLVQRLSVYLIINSILFIAFVQLLKERGWLGYVVAAVGLAVCIVALFHFFRIGDRLGEIEKELSGKDEALGLPHGKLEKLGLIGGKRRARWEVAVILAFLFLFIWTAGLIYMCMNA